MQRELYDIVRISTFAAVGSQNMRIIGSGTTREIPPLLEGQEYLALENFSINPSSQLEEGLEIEFNQSEYINSIVDIFLSQR